KLSGKTNTFYFWSTEEGRKLRSQMGGKASSKTNQAFIQQQGSFKDITLARRAGARSAKHPVTNGIITRKFHTSEEAEDFISQNPDWRRGQHNTTPGNPGNTVRRRGVTDGTLTFDAVLHAAEYYKVSSATI